MSFKVQYCLSIVILILVLNGKCSEATKLFNITEEAINAGREMIREVEKTNSPNANVTAMAKAVHGLLEKFHNWYNKPTRDNFIDTRLAAELGTDALKSQFLELHRFVDSAAIQLNLLVAHSPIPHGKVIWTPLLFYLEENVFDLQKYKTTQLRLKNMFNVMFKKDPETGDNIMNILTKEPSKWLCWSASRQQMLYSILDFIIAEEAFEYIMTQYFYAGYKYYYDAKIMQNKDLFRDLKMIKSTWKEKDVINQMKSLENDFIERNTILLNKFVEAMAGQSREAWSCDENRNEDHDKRLYTKLANLFQMYIVNEVDLNEDGTCKKECTDYHETKLYDCYDGGICKRQRTCNGKLWDCDTQIASPMQVCLKDKKDTIRYYFITTSVKNYGPDDYCVDDTIEAKSWPRGFVKCTYCTCTCEEMNDNGDRYFNLRPVQSDINSNYVITNAKFVKENNIVHIQIEEGQLLNDGYINQSSLIWKEIENYTTYDENVKEYDFHTITWNKRKVYLGDLDSPANNVLTGLRISSVVDGIKLDIGYTAYDFTTGKLISNTSEWSSHSQLAHEWSELKFENKDEIVTDSNSKYTKFTTSNLKIDAGQTTIPYLVTDKVIYRMHGIPLSGAGLFTQSKKDVGSFLALKLLTYDFVNNL